MVTQATMGISPALGLLTITGLVAAVACLHICLLSGSAAVSLERAGAPDLRYWLVGDRDLPNAVAPALRLLSA